MNRGKRPALDRPRAVSADAGGMSEPSRWARAGFFPAWSRDWLFWRTLAVLVALSASFGLVSIATDEAGNTFGMRIARFAALVPAAASLGALVVVSHSRSRGELRALESLGLAPWAAVRGVRNAALLFGLLTPLCLSLPATDTSSLFPVVGSTVKWREQGSAMFAEASGALVQADGHVSLGPTRFIAPARNPWRKAALLALVPIALVSPLWAVTPMRLGVRVSSAALTLAASIIGLHAVAAMRVSGWAGVTSALPVLLATFWARRRRSAG